jgi:hypothetical protein
MKRCLSLLLTLAACTTLQAQTVWRCGADGRSYGDTACADGRVVAVADSRSAGEAAAAREVLARDQRLARTLVAERHDREREWAARGNGLSGIGGAAAVKAAAKEPAAKPHPKKQRQLRKPRSAGAGTSGTTDHATRRAPG